MTKRNNKPLTASMFTPMQTWYSAQDKADYGNALIRFIESDFNPNLFTKNLYQHLSCSFGHIAHYNLAGFYDTWFSTLAQRVEWFQHVIAHAPVGSPAFTRCDVEGALQGEIRKRGYLEKYTKLLQEQVQNEEIALLKKLQGKYPNVTA